MAEGGVTGQGEWRRRLRPWLALALCWMLCLQAALSGLTVAAHAAPGSAGFLAAVICTPDGVRLADDPGGAPADRHDLSCCLLGCAGSGTGFAHPAAAVRVPHPAAASSPIRVQAAAAALAGTPRTAHGARAPPHAA